LQRLQYDVCSNSSDQSALTALERLHEQLAQLREEWAFSPVRPEAEYLCLAAELETQIRRTLAKRHPA
jgi:hypothetical protein